VVAGERTKVFLAEVDSSQDGAGELPTERVLSMQEIDRIERGSAGGGRAPESYGPRTRVWAFRLVVPSVSRRSVRDSERDRISFIRHKLTETGLGNFTEADRAF